MKAWLLHCRNLKFPTFWHNMLRIKARNHAILSLTRNQLYIDVTDDVITPIPWTTSRLVETAARSGSSLLERKKNNEWRIDEFHPSDHVENDRLMVLSFRPFRDLNQLTVVTCVEEFTLTTVYDATPQLGLSSTGRHTENWKRPQIGQSFLHVLR